LPGLLTANQCLEVHAGAKGLSSVGVALLELAEELKFTPYLESFVDTLSLGTLDIVEHNADRAGLLIEGRLIREWQKEEIESLRANGGGFDAALAETITR
jgi:hypothetical protein